MYVKTDIDIKYDVREYYSCVPYTGGTVLNFPQICEHFSLALNATYYCFIAPSKFPVKQPLSGHISIPAAVEHRSMT